jgi:glycosyltransferase involved in cell wall biosynthesis
MISLPAYVIITPARNEAELIELTLRSVVSQRVRPLKWIIVSDGSTDGTDEIVNRYAAEHPWIELVRMPVRGQRNFAAKVTAFNAGRERIADLSYDVIANLDADTSFDADYFSYFLEKLAENPDLGVSGGKLVDRSSGEERAYSSNDPEYVSGPCQIFRRACFEAIGGYRPMKSGGVDLVAVLSARMMGWKVRVFCEKVCVHHRSMNGAQINGFRERLHRGRMDYLLGSHPLWELARSIYQMKNRPYILGGVLIFWSYFWRQCLGVRRTMPEDLIAFRRKDQMRRLTAKFQRWVPSGSKPATGTKTA